MQKVRGVRVGYRVKKIFKWITTRKQSNYKSFRRINSPIQSSDTKTKLLSWISSMKQCAKRLCYSKKRSGYIRVGQDPDETVDAVYWVPKGHLAIYVGEKQDNARRVLVPLVYFNHPLFEGLLKEAEDIYGFDHPGGIQIPCRVSEFETVKTKIAAASGGANGQLRRSLKGI